MKGMYKTIMLKQNTIIKQNGNIYLTQYETYITIEHITNNDATLIAVRDDIKEAEQIYNRCIIDKTYVLELIRDQM